MNGWYVVHTQPQSEEKAAFHLRRQDYAVYLPRYLKTVRHARRREVKPAPLFPRYLFVGFDVAVCRWRAIMSSVGVSHLICNSAGPVAVPEDVMAALRARQQDDGYVVLAEPLQFQRGDPLVIHEGPFADCSALFESRDDDDRVTLLMAIMGRETRIRVPTRAIMTA